MAKGPKRCYSNFDTISTKLAYVMLYGLQPSVIEFLAKFCIELFDEVCHEPKLIGQSVLYWRGETNFIYHFIFQL
jgi:hypothetical protein